MVKGYELTDCRRAYFACIFLKAAHKWIHMLFVVFQWKAKSVPMIRCFFVYVDYYCHLPPFPVLSCVIFGECVAWTHNNKNNNSALDDYAPKHRPNAVLFGPVAGLCWVKTHIAAPLAAALKTSTLPPNERRQCRLHDIYRVSDVVAQIHKLETAHNGPTVWICEQRQRRRRKKHTIWKKKKKTWRQKEHEPIPFHISSFGFLYWFLSFSVLVSIWNLYVFVFRLSLSLPERRKLCCFGCSSYVYDFFCLSVRRICEYVCGVCVFHFVYRSAHFRFINVWWEYARTTLVSAKKLWYNYGFVCLMFIYGSKNSTRQILCWLLVCLFFFLDQLRGNWARAITASVSLPQSIPVDHFQHFIAIAVAASDLVFLHVESIYSFIPWL